MSSIPKLNFLFLTLFLTGCATALAERSIVPEVGLSFSAPSGWQALGSESDFFYIFKGPQGQIKFHFAHKDAKTPEEALKISASQMENFKSEKASSPTLQSSKAFKTKTGIKGIKGIFGHKNQKLPSVVKYFVPNADGKIICVCVDLCKTTEDFEFLEKVILETLQQEKKAN